MRCVAGANKSQTTNEKVRVYIHNYLFPIGYRLRHWDGPTNRVPVRLRDYARNRELP